MRDRFLDGDGSETPEEVRRVFETTPNGIVTEEHTFSREAWERLASDANRYRPIMVPGCGPTGLLLDLLAEREGHG